MIVREQWLADFRAIFWSGKKPFWVRSRVKIVDWMKRTRLSVQKKVWSSFRPLSEVSSGQIRSYLLAVRWLRSYTTRAIQKKNAGYSFFGYIDRLSFIGERPLRWIFAAISTIFFATDSFIQDTNLKKNCWVVLTAKDSRRKSIKVNVRPLVRQNGPPFGQYVM